MVLKVLRHISSVKKLLIINFFLLLFFQIVVGFRDLDDYLVIFIFALFMNDMYFKLTRPIEPIRREEKLKRISMTLFLIVLVSMPIILEYFHVRPVTQSIIGKGGLILWAQIFLLDSFIHYRETHSKKWLVFANMGCLFVLFFAIVI